MILVQDDDVVEAVAAQGPDEASIRTLECTLGPATGGKHRKS